MVRRLVVALAVTLAIGIIHAAAQHQHDMSLSQRGAQVMGFSQEKTTHHFELNEDGGIIEARANDIKDAETLDQIRGHFQHIVKLFAAGDFNAPMLVHAQNVPGTATMSRLKDGIHYSLTEIPRAPASPSLLTTRKQSMRSTTSCASRSKTTRLATARWCTRFTRCCRTAVTPLQFVIPSQA